MESVVAALLRDFENGKLTRRPLVQTWLSWQSVRQSRQPGSAIAARGGAMAQPSRPPVTAVVDHISYGIETKEKHEL